MEAVREPVMLMEIEKELAGPDREGFLVKYDAVLSRLDKRIAEAMKDGFPPDEYPKVEMLKEANILARKILRLTVKEGGLPQKT